MRFLRGRDSGPPQDPSAALWRHLEHAKPVPLTSQVRVDRNAVAPLVEALRPRLPDPSAGDRFLEALQGAKPIPLTFEVRLERDAVDAMLAALRTLPPA